MAAGRARLGRLADGACRPQRRHLCRGRLADHQCGRAGHGCVLAALYQPGRQPAGRQQGPRRPGCRPGHARHRKEERTVLLQPLLGRADRGLPGPGAAVRRPASRPSRRPAARLRSGWEPRWRWHRPGWCRADVRGISGERATVPAREMPFDARRSRHAALGPARTADQCAERAALRSADAAAGRIIAAALGRGAHHRGRARRRRCRAAARDHRRRYRLRPGPAAGELDAAARHCDDH